MKVTINKDSQDHQFNLINNWSDVTLDTYSELIRYKKKNNSSEAYKLIKELTDIPKQFAKALSLKDIAAVLSNLAEIQSLQDSELLNIIRIDGVNYGFHPNLEEITLGEFADLETYIQQGYENHLKEILAILYRPVTKQDKKKYNIEPYDGNIEERLKAFGKMKAKQVQGALVFFYDFGSVLLVTLQSFLMEAKLKPLTKGLKGNLPISGAGLE